MAAKTDLEDQSSPNIASSSNAVFIPAKFEFDTMQNTDLTTGFRAPPTSPCNTFVGGGGTTMTNLMSKLQMENCTLPHITPQEIELQNELIKQRKRGRKSAPHVATLFSSPPRNKDDESENADSSFATSSSIPSSSSLFGGGQGNYPPPNSPENAISSSMLDQNVSMLENLSCSSIGDQEEQPGTSCPSITERATQLSQLKTQLHLTHKLEQIRQTSDSNAGIE